jgi:RNA polymerase sigma factor (sigma-70 family)
MNGYDTSEAQIAFRQPRLKLRRTDASLIRAARSGSEEAAESLVRRHWDEAVRSALLITRDPHAAQDIAQEGILAALAALDRFNLRKPFRPWLHRIVVRRALDHLRRQKGQGQLHADLTAELPAAAAGESDSLGDQTVEAMGQLEALDRAIVVMSAVLDYRSHEIGQAVGLPAPTVRTRLRRALKKLESQLEKQGVRQ